MGAVRWEPIADQERFAQARRQLHSLIQWLARMQRSFGPDQADGEPIRLTWHASRRAIETQPFGDRLSIELRLPEMVLQFLEDGVAVSHPFEAEDHSPAHVEAWLLVEMLHRGVDRSRFSKALPYDVSGLMSGDSAEFAPEAYEPELAVLTTYLTEAAGVLTRAAGTDTDGPIAVRPDDLSLESVRHGRDVIGFRAGPETCSDPVFYIRSQNDSARSPEATFPVSRICVADATNVAQFFESGRIYTTH